MSSPAKSPTKANPSAWFQQAIKSHQETEGFLHKAKNAAIITGWFLLQARNACQHGEWEDITAEFETKISYRTVRAYIQFAEDALVSVIAEKKKLTAEQVKSYELTNRELADAALRDAAETVVIQSAANFTELARELRVFRKFGEHDAVQYAAAKARAAKGNTEPRQIEFNWELSLHGLRSLGAIDRVPVDKLDGTKLADLETQLTAALAKVRDARANLQATDLPATSPTAAGEPSSGRTGTTAQEP
jgi:hypothetical protein